MRSAGRTFGDIVQDKDPLDLIERNLIVSPVVKSSGARTLVVGHLLRNFKPATVTQVLVIPVARKD